LRWRPSYLPWWWPFFGTAATAIEPSKYKLLSLFIVPLYVKRKKNKTLDNFVRGQIFGFIQANPGTHYNFIKRALNLNNGTLAYHLNVLEKDTLISSQSDGFFRRFYPKESRIPQVDSNDGLEYTHVQLNKTQDLIIKTIQKQPGLTQKQIAKELGKSTQVVNYNVNTMTQLGLIKLKRKGNKTKCYTDRIYRLDDSINGLILI
jgi:predicted transcriptional regulator